MKVLHQPLTDDQQDRLTTSELRYYQSNYGNPTFERRMKRLQDTANPNSVKNHNHELLRVIIRNYGWTDPNQPTSMERLANLIEAQKHCVISDNCATDPNYWDCECKERYIHPKTLIYCPRCKAYRDDSPDSRVIEINDLSRNYF